MKYKLVIIFTNIFLSVADGKCTTTIALPDTVAKPWRIKEPAFIEKYGENEKTKKFIEAWFTKRHLFTALSAAGGAVTVGLAFLIKEPSQNSGNAYAGLLVAGIVFAVAIGTLFTFGFFIPFLAHSRKRLYRILEKHKNGEKIPKRFKRKLEGD